MTDDRRDERSRRHIRQVFLLCIGLTVATACAVLAAQLIPGSPYGGMDGPAIILYLTFLAALYLVVPAHVVGAIGTLFCYLRADDRAPYVLALGYFAVWLVGAFALVIFSGAANPVFDEIADRQYRAENESGMALIDAVRQPKDDARALELIAAGADVNVADPQFGMRPLHWAAKHSRADVVQALLDAGADPNQRYPRTWDYSYVELGMPSPLDFAAWSEHDAREKVDVLLAAGATVTPQSVLAACASGDAEFLDVLIAAGGDPVTAHDGDRMTCLHVAARKGDLALATRLLERGADPNAALEHSIRPLDRAIEHEHVDVAIAIAAAGGRAHNPRKLDDVILAATPEQFDALAAARPLAGIEGRAATRLFSRTVMSCELENARRLLAAGLVIPESGHRDLRVPEHCADRVALLELLDRVR